MKDRAIFNLYPNITQIEEIDGVFVCKDKDNNIVEVSDWDAVDAKVIEMQQEAEEKETKRKEDKLSAYRKLSLTDDEINTLDPTLLSEE